jgi:hypothetical protein
MYRRIFLEILNTAKTSDIMEELKISREEKVALYNKLVATNPNAVRKGDTIPYTSLNGHMYSFLTKDDVVALRLPSDERVKFLDKYKSKLVEQYGIVQKEYVVVPDSLLAKIDELTPYFEISHKYISSLKPKASAKAKKKC